MTMKSVPSSRYAVMPGSGEQSAVMDGVVRHCIPIARPHRAGVAFVNESSSEKPGASNKDRSGLPGPERRVVSETSPPRVFSGEGEQRRKKGDY